MKSLAENLARLLEILSGRSGFSASLSAVWSRPCCCGNSLRCCNFKRSFPCGGACVSPFPPTPREGDCKWAVSWEATGLTFPRDPGMGL